MARASATTVRVRSRRARFAASRVSACRPASTGSSASSRRAASSASPIRPAALRRGARANEIVSRSTAGGVDLRALQQGREAGAGVLPETVEARAARSPGSRRRPARRRRRCRSSPGRPGRAPPADPPGWSARSSWAILKATPLPASRRSGYVESGRCGLTTAYAGWHDLGDAVVVGHDDVQAAGRWRRRSRRGSWSRSPRSRSAWHPPSRPHPGRRTTARGPRRAGSGRTESLRRRTGAGPGS